MTILIERSLFYANSKGANTADYPATRQFRQEMYEEILKEFNAVMEKEEQQEEDSNVNEEQYTEG